MDPSQDPPEEPARPDEQRDPVTDPTQPVLFWDVQLSQKDVQNWTKKGAFRHFYMNWCEGMNQVFQFAIRPTIHYTETDDFLFINAANPVPLNGPWGFILYNKEKGILSLNIRDGRKLRGYLEQSQMSTNPSNNLLKAAMVMTLAGYQVCFESSQDRWDFFFSDTGSFCFTRSPSTEVSFLSSLNQSSNGASPPENVSTGDLAITIGPGESATCRRVEREKLVKWLSVTIDIQDFLQPRQIIYTGSGDLILDPDFANKVFVNGIQVVNPRAGAFLLGYQFYDEELVTETGVLRLDDKEARLRCLIWEEVMGKKEQNLNVFVAFLRFNPDALDVRSVEKFLSPDTVRKVWEFLVNDLGREKIFCQETDDLYIVNRRTNREPVVLPNTLWSILRTSWLIRTWAEELLYKAPPAEPTLDNRFTVNVKRVFDALLQLDPETANLTIIWVDHPLGPQLVSSDSKAQRIVLSRNWLNFDCAHTFYPCRHSDVVKQRSVNYVQCDHLILAMHAELVQFVAQRFRSSSPAVVADWLKRVQKMAAERVEEMPRCVEVVGDDMDPDRGYVTWELGLSKQNARFVESGYHVVMHSGNCETSLETLVHIGEVNTSSPTAPCGCPQTFVGRQETQAAFDGLSPDDTFIPSVALNAKGSIYAVPIIKDPEELASQASETELLHIERVRREHAFNLNENWNKTNFPVLFAQFTPRIGSIVPSADQIVCPPVPVAVFENPRLPFRFERCQYVKARMRGSTQEDREQFILYIHAIHVPGAMSPMQGEGRLTVTVYSFLRTTPICLFHLGLTALAQDRGKEDVGLKELLLHFQNFDVMGSRQDAIVLSIESIESVEAVDSRALGAFEAVQYTVDPPDPSRTGYYCRFAIRCNGHRDAACVMPVASHLLTHSKRWPEPRYAHGARLSVIDLTPGCLGPAEAFMQLGARIDGAVGFDPAQHCTWKARYPSAKLYDGHLETVLNDLKRKRLNQPPCDPRPAPRIILLSLPEKEQALQTWDRSVEEAKIFRAISLILSAFTQRPDFLVLSLPPWILFGRAYQELFKGIWTLLTSRYAVHMRNVRFTEYGLPRDGCMVVVVASCVPTPIPWDSIFRATAQTTGNRPNTSSSPASVQSVIEDLAFANPRNPAPGPAPDTGPGTGPAVKTGFICKNPHTGVDVYNHQTNPRLTSPPSTTTDTNTSTHNHPLTAPISIPRLAATIHPQTLPPRPVHQNQGPNQNLRGGDLLTVREIARVQGFPDGFVFLGPLGVQRREVLEAWPVFVGRMVGWAVFEVVGEFGFGAASVNVNVNVNIGGGTSASASASASTGGNQRQGQGQGQRQVQRGQKRPRES